MDSTRVAQALKGEGPVAVKLCERGDGRVKDEGDEERDGGGGDAAFGGGGASTVTTGEV